MSGAGNPAVANLDVGPLHREPGNAVRARLVTWMGHKCVVERLTIDVLRVRRQMSLDRIGRSSFVGECH
jgi:hypothetical protein